MRARSLCGSLIVGASLLAFSLPANAVSTIAGDGSFGDTYFGGLNTYNNTPPASGDVIGNADYYIFGGSATRTGNDLSVTIYTNYVNNVGADNTALGALFLGSGTPVFNTGGQGGSVDAVESKDRYDYNRGRFQIAVTPGGGVFNVSGDTGSPGANGTDVVVSNVNGNPTTANLPGNPGYYFREGQAVGVTSTAPTLAGVTATVSTNSLHPYQTDASWTPSNSSSITFNLSDVFGAGGLADTFFLAWEMTCANDVIFAQGTLHATGTTPLPAGLPLFMSGLGLIGLLAKKRKRRAVAAA